MSKILISYRRADAEAIAGRIRDKLVAHYGEKFVAIGAGYTPYGTDVRDHFQQALTDNEYFIAVIGKNWLGVGADGRVAIKERNDPVRVEIEAALAKGSTILPILVAGGHMPEPDDLPVNLAPFASRPVAIDAGPDFHQQMDQLIRSMDRRFAAKGARPEVSNLGASAAPAAMHPGSMSLAKPNSGEASAAAKTARTSARWLVPALVIGIAALGGGFAWRNFGPSPASLVATSQTPSPTPSSAAKASEPVTFDDACNPSQPAILHDGFKTVDPAWQITPNTPISIQDQELTIRHQPGRGWLQTYRPLVFTDASACTLLKTPSVVPADGSEARAGLVFWSNNIQNYYLALIYLDGRYGIFRAINNNTVIVVPPTRSDAIKTGAGATNELTLTTRGSHASFFVNHQPVAEISGQPPSSGGSFGVSGRSDAHEEVLWTFSTFVLVDSKEVAAKRR